MIRILLAEDEAELARAVAAVLKSGGYETEVASNGEEAVEKGRSSYFDVYVFDIMMPKKDGIEALKELRDAGINTPAIFLTAKAEIEDRVTGLDAGADDYLTKPFAMAELMARIRSLTRRSAEATTGEIRFEDIVLDIEGKTLSCNSSIGISAKEVLLAELLIRNGGKVMDENEIYERLFKDEEDKTVVSLYISYLKNKLKSIGSVTGIYAENGGYGLKSQ
ncbi:MAG: response regulator transcription factor [Lachnospiraceae bacterium]|nr:response regulator transcription factor [Lachnospiraceae bacterium]